MADQFNTHLENVRRFIRRIIRPMSLRYYRIRVHWNYTLAHTNRMDVVSLFAGSILLAGDAKCSVHTTYFNKWKRTRNIH